MTIGQRLTACRHMAGLTQAEVARQLMITPQAVSRWECDNGTPDITMLLPLAALYGVTTDELLGADRLGADISMAVDALGDSETGTARERYEKCRHLMREHPFDPLVLSRLLELTAQRLYEETDATDEERDALMNDADFLVTAMRTHGTPSGLDARIRAAMADIYTAMDEDTRAENEMAGLPGARYTRARVHGIHAAVQGMNDTAMEDFRTSFTESLVWLLWDLERLAECSMKNGSRETLDSLYTMEYDIIKAVSGDTDFPWPLEYFWQTALMRRAQKAAREGRTDEAFGYLESYMAAARAAIAHFIAGCAEDAVPDGTAASLWLDATTRRIFFRRGYADSCRKRTEYFLGWRAFDGIRQDARFADWARECADWQG